MAGSGHTLNTADKVGRIGIGRIDGNDTRRVQIQNNRRVGIQRCGEAGEDIAVAAAVEVELDAVTVAQVDRGTRIAARVADRPHAGTVVPVQTQVGGDRRHGIRVDQGHHRVRCSGGTEVRALDQGLCHQRGRERNRCGTAAAVDVINNCPHI